MLRLNFLRNINKTESRKAVWLLLLLYTVVLSANLIVNIPSYRAGANWRFSITFSLTVTTIGWAGYWLLYYRIFKHLDWRRSPVRNLFFSTITSGLFGIGVMVLSMLTLVMLGKGRVPDIYDYSVNCMYAGLFSMMLGLVVNGQHFLLQWKKSAEDNERMKTELLQSQFETLKSQINPHFLFNSLNTLNGLIDEYPTKAKAMIQNLSLVLRYSLQYRNEDRVLLITELSIVRSFLAIYQERFGDRLTITITIPDHVAVQKCIVIHALLTLIENALKHNEVSALHPLSLAIFEEEGYLIVKNSYRPRQSTQPESGIGLANIVERYNMITSQPVYVKKDNNFTVKIPLLPL